MRDMHEDPSFEDLLPDALTLLERHARPEAVAGLVRFGIPSEGRMGIAVPDLRRIARQLGRRQALADALWDCGLPEARILAGMVAEPARLTVRQMDAWVRDLDAWDVCDQLCGNAVAASPHAWGRAQAWAGRKSEFVRRAGFALLATLAVHDKAASDERFIEALAWIEAAADDDRNFVRKAVNWALRNIGKRNRALNAAAIDCAERLRTTDAKAARWIASDALRELRGEAVQAALR